MIVYRHLSGTATAVLSERQRQDREQQFCYEPLP
jgi:hypothetical protein